MKKPLDKNSPVVTLIKTNSGPKCSRCERHDFIKYGLGWACFYCGLYIYPQLTRDINRLKG